MGKGTGLGLSIVQGIVADHSGSIEVDAKHPNTCLVLRIPKARAAAAQGESGQGQVA